jgi:hypothetical protein
MILNRGVFSIKLPGSLRHYAVGCLKVASPLLLTGPLLTRTVEHLGLIKPQAADPATAGNMDSYIAPIPNAPEDTTHSSEDALVADPLSDQFQTLWNETAQKNTSILLNIFKTVPNNLVRNWKQYDVCVFLMCNYFLLH